LAFAEFAHARDANRQQGLASSESQYCAVICNSSLLAAEWPKKLSNFESAVCNCTCIQVKQNEFLRNHFLNSLTIKTLITKQSTRDNLEKLYELYENNAKLDLVCCIHHSTRCCKCRKKHFFANAPNCIYGHKQWTISIRSNLSNSNNSELI